MYIYDSTQPIRDTFSHYHITLIYVSRQEDNTIEVKGEIVKSKEREKISFMP